MKLVRTFLFGAAVGADVLRRRHVPIVTNVVHWLYGVSWGVLYGLAARRLRPSPLAGYGATVAATYAALER